MQLCQVSSLRAVKYNVRESETKGHQRKRQQINSIYFSFFGTKRDPINTGLCRNVHYFCYQLRKKSKINKFSKTITKYFSTITQY